MLTSLIPAGKLMANLMKQATALGVKDRVVWLDEYVPTEELMDVIKCTSVFLTPFDENTPTSVSITAPTKKQAEEMKVSVLRRQQ